MKNEKVKKDYLKKISLLQKYNQFYYDKNKSLISDQEFDLIKKEIFQLEEKYSFLKSKESPSKVVGFKPSKNFKELGLTISQYYLV